MAHIDQQSNNKMNSNFRTLSPTHDLSLESVSLQDDITSRTDKLQFGLSSFVKHDDAFSTSCNSKMTVDFVKQHVLLPQKFGRARRQTSLNRLLSGTNVWRTSSSSTSSYATSLIPHSPLILQDQQQQQQQGHLDLSYSTKAISLSNDDSNTSEDKSLTDVTANGTRMKRSYHSTESDLLYGYEKTPLHDNTDYGDEEKLQARQKRRRFARRNSKTPAMLMAMLSPLLSDTHQGHGTDSSSLESNNSEPLLSGICSGHNDGSVSPPFPSSGTTSSSSYCALSLSTEPSDTMTPSGMNVEDELDNGIDVAEDLVFQLQKRRKVQWSAFPTSS
jgi:hypothetical protein